MKKFNLIKEIIVADKVKLVDVINSKKVFGINIYGDICFEPFNEKEMLVFKSTLKDTTSLSDFFGNNYQVVEDDDRVLLKAFANWQEIIKLNTSRASYDDTTSDGVDRFQNEELEKLGWYATEFDITYRQLVEVLEEKCDGTLLCIERDEPYQFSGLGFLEDDKQAFEELFGFVQNIIQNLLENDPLYVKENLTDDEEEAMEFFKLS